MILGLFEYLHKFLSGKFGTDLVIIMEGRRKGWDKRFFREKKSRTDFCQKKIFMMRINAIIHKKYSEQEY